MLYKSSLESEKLIEKATLLATTGFNSSTYNGQVYLPESLYKDYSYLIVKSYSGSSVYNSTHPNWITSDDCYSYSIFKSSNLSQTWYQYGKLQTKPQYIYDNNGYKCVLTRKYYYNDVYKKYDEIYVGNNDSNFYPIAIYGINLSINNLLTN